jgi:NADH:ubiquinone oxidoreductase subunit 6 (subunit J)
LRDYAAAPARDLPYAIPDLGVIAFPLFQDYVVPFEITGILLLVAVVGAIVLAKRRVGS